MNREANGICSSCKNCGSAVTEQSAALPSPIRACLRPAASSTPTTSVFKSEPSQDDQGPSRYSTITGHNENGRMQDKFFDQQVELSIGPNGTKLMDGEIVKVESFDDLELITQLSANVARAGYTKPTPIQKYAMRSIQDGKDLMACSQTGSGKTAAFLLPIMNKLIWDADLSLITDGPCRPQALILAPTRELAIQIHAQATKFAEGTLVKCEIAYGGCAFALQKKRVEKGVIILVGTVGRIKHFVNEDVIDLDQTKFLVLDEADRMLDMGFAEEVKEIMKNGGIPGKEAVVKNGVIVKEARQTLLFSVMFPKAVRSLANELLRDDYLKIVVDKIGAANKLKMLGIDHPGIQDKFFDQQVELSIGPNGTKLTDGEIVKVESFGDLEFVSQQMSTNVANTGYTKPTPIQKYAMRSIQDGMDLMACSQTGSGKTAAFLLPIMNKLLRDADLSLITDGPCKPQALILAPTLELAIQIHAEATKFAEGTLVKCEIAYGGCAFALQKKRVEKGVIILVGTIGRIKHYINADVISLEQTKFLVLDEADRMLDMGFAEEVKEIMENGGIAGKEPVMENGVIVREARQTLLFSATFPKAVRRSLANELLRDDYLKIVVDKIGAANKSITQDFVQVERRNKKATLLKMLGVDQQKYEQSKDLQVVKQKTPIFGASKTMADTLGVFISEAGVPTTTTRGDREQYQRESAWGGTSFWPEVDWAGDIGAGWKQRWNQAKPARNEWGWCTCMGCRNSGGRQCA